MLGLPQTLRVRICGVPLGKLTTAEFPTPLMHSQSLSDDGVATGVAVKVAIWVEVVLVTFTVAGLPPLKRLMALAPFRLNSGCAKAAAGISSAKARERAVFLI